jgi:ATP-dependent DNA helicase DinG
MTSNKIRGAEDSTLAHKSRGRGAGRDELSLPALVVGAASAHWRAPDGGDQTLSHATAAAYAARQAPLVCHAAATARRLRTEPFAAYDLLELYAFVRPARFCTPTPRGLARALGLPVPAPLADQAALLPTAAGRLLQELSALEAADRRAAWAIAWTLTQAGWAWQRSRRWAA